MRAAIALMNAPSGGFRLASAIFSASSASSAVMFGPIDQPTMRRDHMSITSAKYSKPWRVFTQAMSANHAMLGPPASNLRPTTTRSSADSCLDASRPRGAWRTRAYRRASLAPA